MKKPLCAALQRGNYYLKNKEPETAVDRSPDGGLPVAVPDSVGAEAPTDILSQPARAVNRGEDDVPRVFAMLDEKNIPYTVDVKNTNQGYRGIHILWNADGIGVELQLSTPEAWKIKMQTEDIYAKLREMDFAALSDEAKAEYDRMRQQSIELWDSIQLPDFNRLTTSASDRTRPSMNSSPYIGEIGFTQKPLTSSLSQPSPTASGVWQNTRPESVSTYDDIQSPPNNNILPQESDIVNGGGDIQRGDSAYTKDVNPTAFVQNSEVHRADKN